MIKTIITIFVIVTSLSTGWYFMFNNPAEAKIATLRLNVETAENKLRVYHEALRQIDEYLNQFDSLQAALIESGSSLSGTDEVITLYRFLDSLCGGQQYTLEEISPSLEEVIHFLKEWKKSESLAYIPIQIKIKARYIDLAELIEVIEASTCFDHLLSCRITGYPDLYPYCHLELVFSAGLFNRLGMFDFE